MRVVRFYVCSPLPCPSPSPPFSPPSFSQSSSQISTCSSRSQCAAPDLTREVQIAVCSAGPYRGAPERTVQHRTSPGDLPSGPCSTGPHPGSSQIDRAAPDLSCQKICQKISFLTKNMSKNMSEKNVRRYARRNVRGYVNRNVR